MPPIEYTQKFQSTLSVWRATYGYLRAYLKYDVSIHALRVESDSTSSGKVVRTVLVSIHALRVESDTLWGLLAHQRRGFQSTLSVWRATTR